MPVGMSGGNPVREPVTSRFAAQEQPTAVLASLASATPGQVFVDDSGRRRRWARFAGIGVTVVCAAYIGVVAFGFTRTDVGPLESVPAGNNGQIGGLGTSTGVPGILSAPNPIIQRGRVTEPKRRAPAPSGTPAGTVISPVGQKTPPGGVQPTLTPAPAPTTTGKASKTTKAPSGSDRPTKTGSPATTTKPPGAGTGNT